MNIALITFAISIVFPFFFLTPIWATASLAYVSVVGPIISMLPVAIFKSVKFTGTAHIGYVVGTLEGLALLLLSNVLNAPHEFVYMTWFIYIVNQSGRITKYTGEQDYYEAKQLLGYSAVLAANLFIK